MIDVRTILCPIDFSEQAAGADLLAIGTHGQSGFDRLILGSVTEKILRKAHCSRRALDHPVSFARTAGARLTVLHVMVYRTEEEAPERYETLLFRKAQAQAIAPPSSSMTSAGYSRLDVPPSHKRAKPPRREEFRTRAKYP
jgi:nucleotide-binding universal stress UspA family protein